MMFTIGEKDNLLIGWKNNHDFGDINAPQIDEIFLQLFTEPWIAQKYIDEELKRDDVYIYKIDFDSWEYYRDLAIQTMDIHRAIINLCNVTKSHLDGVLFNMQSINDLEFSTLIENTQNMKICSECYNKNRFVSSNNPDRKIKVFELKY